MEPSGLAAAQFEPTPGDPAANLETIEALAGSLPAETELAVFPELAVTGYDLDAARDLAQPVPGEFTDTLVSVADRFGLHLAVGLPEALDGSVYNALAYLSPDGVEAVYRKRHLWGAESDRLAAADEPVVVETPIGRVGLLVCYDLNFPERGVEYARREVDVLAVSSAWRADFLDDWRLLVRARGLDGSCYVVGSNHLGDQNGREHAGHSLVVGPTGDVLDEVGQEPSAAFGTLTRGKLDRARRRNPVFRDRSDADRDRTVAEHDR